MGEQFRTVCGEEVGRRFKDEFATAAPSAMGFIVGRVEGYLAAEIAMLLIGAEEIAAVGKAISAGARALEASGFALKILAALRRIAAFRALIEAGEAAKAAKRLEGAEEAAKLRQEAEKAAKLRQEAEEAPKQRVGSQTPAAPSESPGEPPPESEPAGEKAFGR